MINNKIYQTPQYSTTKTSLSDLGEVAYLKIIGISHDDLALNGVREVLFCYNNDLRQYLDGYWSDKAKVSPREYKLLLDSLKRLVFSYLRSSGVR